MLILKILLFLVVLAVVAVVGFWVMLAARSKREYDNSNEVVPGLRTNAPKAWAGAHTPEAKLHRRLRDVVVALRAIPGLEGAPGRIEVERLAMSLDERLVAVAALPQSQRDEPLTMLTEDVTRLEAAVGELTTQIVAERVPVERALAGLSLQLGYLAAARAELEAMSAPTDLDAVADRLHAANQPVPVLPPQAPAFPPQAPLPQDAVPGTPTPVTPPPLSSPPLSAPSSAPPQSAEPAWSTPPPLPQSPSWPASAEPAPDGAAAWPVTTPSQEPSASPPPAPRYLDPDESPTVPVADPPPPSGEPRTF